MALTAKNKLCFVDRTIVPPPPDDLLYGAWICCNSMVISWIHNSVSRDVADCLIYIPTTSEMWIDLRDRFLQSNALRIFQIKKLLTDLHQGSMNISAYYTRLRTLWDELKDFQPIAPCHCGSMKQRVNFQNHECVLQFLMGLNDSYAQIRAQILMMDPLPVISKAFSLLGDSLTPSQFQQLLTFLTAQLRLGSVSAQAQQQEEPSMSCFHGTLLSSPHFHTVSSKWILDTGATHHICCALSSFKSCKPCTISVRLPNGASLQATHIGVDPTTKKVIGMGRCIGNLYVFTDFTAISTPTICKVSSNKTDLWNFRMRHPSLKKLSVVGHELHFHPIVNDVSHCSICHMSKQKRLPFTSTGSISKNPFVLVHIDVWGPLSPVSVEVF
ncbi:uncharacterized protein [Primulina eburnea]|uniref:uncharacterized protein n=1 Tax=Primulina eburnea TaxID=1245227 RepID=UPI003C6C1BB9